MGYFITGTIVYLYIYTVAAEKLVDFIERSEPSRILTRQDYIGIHTLAFLWPIALIYLLIIKFISVIFK